MKKMIYYAIVVIVAIVFNFVIIQDVKRSREINLNMNITIKTEKTSDMQVFYSSDKNWEENKSYKYELTSGNNEISVPISTINHFVRIDFKPEESRYDIVSIELEKGKNRKKLDIYEVGNNSEYNMIQTLPSAKTLQVFTQQDDPYICIDLEQYSLKSFAEKAEHTKLIVMHILICVLINVLFVILLFNYKRIKDFVYELFLNRSMIFRLAKNDFKTKYSGSYFGTFWAFVQPIVTVLVYWFVFQVGFNSSSIDGFPFVIWLIAGMVPWFLFNDGWFGGTNCLMEYSYLVKKVVFKISILPIVKIMSAVFVNLFFIAFMLIVYGLYGYQYDLYCIQLLYYECCMIFLLLGLSFICCSLVVFFKDLTQIINIILQIGVWITPIMWNKNMLPMQYMWILKANPIFYIVQGVRDSLLYKKWFWEDIYWTVYFWIIVGILFFIGITIFKKLRVHFSDVL